MDCKYAREQLGALLDGELEAKDKEAILLHIAECPDCRKEYEELKKLRKEFEKLDFKLHGALADSVMQRIYAETPQVQNKAQKKKKPFIFRYMGTAAAFAVILTLFIYTRIAPPQFDAKGMESNDAPEAFFQKKEETSEEKVMDGNFTFSVRDESVYPEGPNEPTVEEETTAPYYPTEQPSLEDSADHEAMPDTEISESTTSSNNALLGSDPQETAPEEPVKSADTMNPSAQPTPPSSDTLETPEKLSKPSAESDSIGTPEMPADSSPDPEEEKRVFRIYNSIPDTTAIIFTDAALTALVPLFDDINSTDGACVNTDTDPNEVIDILKSNNIAVTSTDIPKITDNTSVYAG